MSVDKNDSDIKKNKKQIRRGTFDELAKEMEVEGFFASNRVKDEVMIRVRKMILLGFGKKDIHESLSLNQWVDSEEETMAYIELLHRIWDEIPASSRLRSEEGRSYARAEMFISDLMDIYQNSLRNYYGTLNGEIEHPDGTPVVETKSNEVASLAERIIKIETQLLSAKREAISSFGFDDYSQYVTVDFDE